ncbi:MAG: DUF4445 domain-containing protein [Clostridiales bacterium]|nr:DUF4445 domain-containing protein [Clostridiales bacterium]
MDGTIKKRGCPVRISEQEVFRLLDCTPQMELYEEFREEYRELLDPVRKLCEPLILLQPGILPEHPKVEGLPAGSRVLYALCSVGKEVSRYCTAAFGEGDYVKGMLADAMADCALYSLEPQMEELLREYCQSMDVGIGGRYSAPHDAPMELQQLIYEEVDAERYGFSLSSGYMLDPVKSNAMIFGVSPDRDSFRIRHECSRCSNFSCKNRRVEQMKIRIRQKERIWETVLSPGETLLSAIQREAGGFDAPCGGNGRCGKCRILVEEGVLLPEEGDRHIFSEKELSEGWRLACIAKPRMNLTVRLPEAGEEEFQVLASVEEQEKKPEDRDGAWGIAVDIGTTTLAMQRIGLEDGSVSDTWTGVNHQRAYGADVIARIGAACRGDLDHLRTAICRDLETGICTLLQRSECPEKLKKVSITGNTVMLHLLRGYDCSRLGKAPFIPEHLEGEAHLLPELLGGGLPAVLAELLPGIAAFVGADITAGLYACDFDRTEELCMLIDLGTNGEMAVGNCHGILCTSTAAGPAFEGGNISCGMGSLPGAIQRVEIHDGSCRVETILKRPVQGICGTGVLEAAAELYKNDLMDAYGKLEEPYFEEGFLLAKLPDGKKVCLTQKDIREIQLAKAAIRAGIETLLLESGHAAEEVEHVCLAGGFGFYLDLEKAFVTGLFPEAFRGKIRTVGNSALSGCVRYLTDPEGRERMEQIRKLCRETDLSSSAEFQEFYMEHMLFGEE